MDLVRFRFKLGWVELNLVTLFLLGPVRLDWVGFGFGERERASKQASKPLIENSIVSIKHIIFRPEAF